MFATESDGPESHMLTFRSSQSYMHPQVWEAVVHVRKYMVKSEDKREVLLEQNEELRQLKARLQGEVATKKALAKLNMRQKVAYEREIERLHRFPQSMDATDMWKELETLQTTLLHIQTSAPPLSTVPDLQCLPEAHDLIVPKGELPLHTDKAEAAISKARTASAALRATLEATQISRIQDMQDIMKLRRRLEAEVLKSLRQPGVKTIGSS